MILGSLLVPNFNLEKYYSENTNLIRGSHSMKQQILIFIILFIKICTEWIYFMNRIFVCGSDSIQFWALMLLSFQLIFLVELH